MTRAPTDPVTRALTHTLQAAVDTGALPGLTATVVDRDGTRFQGAFGNRASNGDEPMTSDTVMAIMSMTKAVTSVAALQLVERGKLQLDTPAAAICPELEKITVLNGFSASGEPILRAPRRAITLRNLLTHTSGFGYDTWSQDLVRYREQTGTPDIASLKKAALGLPLLFDPGERWEYGIGIDWVGQLVEAASGVTLGQYFAEHITGPLKMPDTAFTPTAGMATRLAAMHMRRSDGSLKPLPSRPVEAPEFEMGGGGLLSTAPDYSRFVRMVLNDGALDGARVLAPESIDLMLRNQMGDLRVQPMRSALPVLSNDAEFFPGEPKSWSLAFQISESDCSTGRKAGTAMWAGLANSYYWIDRASNLAGVYITQVFPFVDQQALAHYYAFETGAYRAFG